jgi:integral membrane protein
MTAPISFLRRTALAEAVSYLVLLGIAMPLKYWAGLPMAVRIAGSLHGLLFIMLCGALFRTWWKAKWPVGRCLLVLAVSFVPVLPFIFDRRMLAWERGER